MMTNPIKTYRDKTGHSQESLARILNVSSRTVQHWERLGLPDNLSVIMPLALAMLEIKDASEQIEIHEYDLEHELEKVHYCKE